MLNFSEGVWAPTFFSHSKFEVKKFSEFINLQSTVDSEFYRGGVRAPTFLVTQNLSKKFFGIFSFTNCSSVRAPTFFGHAKFEVKTFSEFLHLQSAVDSDFFAGVV